MAKAPERGGPEQAHLRRRVLDQRAHGAATGEGTEGREGLRQGPAQLEEQRHVNLLDLPPRGHGRLDERAGVGRREGLPDLREALPLPGLEARADRGDGQPTGAQDAQGQGANREARVLTGVLASLLAGLQPHRGGFLEGEEAVEEGQSEDLRGVGGSERASAFSAVTAKDAGGFFGHIVDTGAYERTHYEKRSRHSDREKKGFMANSGRL